MASKVVWSLRIFFYVLMICIPLAVILTGKFEITCLNIFPMISLFWLNNSGENWIYDQFAILESKRERQLENKALIERVCKSDSALSDVHNSLNDEKKFLSSEELNKSMELYPALEKRRQRFEEQIKFWSQFNQKKYRHLRIYGVDELGQSYGCQCDSMEVDIELYVEVLKATETEYARHMETLKADIDYTLDRRRTLLSSLSDDSVYPKRKRKESLTPEERVYVEDAEDNWKEIDGRQK